MIQDVLFLTSLVFSPTLLEHYFCEMGVNHWMYSIWLCSLHWGEAWSKVPGLTFPCASLCIRIRQSLRGCIKLVTTQSQYWTATVHQEKAQKCSLLARLTVQTAGSLEDKAAKKNKWDFINKSWAEFLLGAEMEKKKKCVRIACGYVYEGCDK